MSNAAENYFMFISAAPFSFAGMAWGIKNWEVLYWGLWITGFLAVELPAVFNAKKGDTFTEVWRRFMRIKGGRNRHGAPVKPFPLWVAIPLHATIVAFGIWLIGHLGFGLWG